MTSYAVTYRVVQNHVPRWEVLTVQRPLGGADLSYDTPRRPGRGDVPRNGAISTPTALYSVDTNGVHLVSGRQPGLAAGDQALAIGLADLTARGLAVELRTGRRVAGHACRVYRFAEPPSGPIRPVDGGADHDDVCLDASGLVLAERWHYHGDVVLDRTAVDVRLGARGVATGPAPIPPPVDLGQVALSGAATVTPDPSPTSFLSSPPTPSGGYRPSGPAVAFRLPDPQQPSTTAAASVVWAFVNGAAVITVEAGSLTGGAVPWIAGDTVTQPLVLRGLGPATTALRSDGAEVRVDLSGGRWVRVRGSVTVAELSQYAQSLVLQGAGGASTGA